jgi:hypothetical protein
MEERLMMKRKSGSLLLLVGIVLVSGGIAIAQNETSTLGTKRTAVDRREIRTDTRNFVAIVVTLWRCS